MEYFKGRTFDFFQKVDCYFNIHKNGFTIRDSKSKLVLAHCDSARLLDCRFHVSESGRQKVLKTKRKSVHAYITGILVAVDEPLDPNHNFKKL